nr:MAG TPA: hypothetical protein [Caudoviricetes sp.]
MQTSGSAAIKKLIQLVKASLSGKMDKSGGTFTGNVSGKYFTGTWLQTTEATDLGRAPGKIAVLDESGWVYYRTPAELLADIGASGGGADYVVEQGSNNFWTWRKWSSGIAELWAVSGIDQLQISSAWGSMYYGTWMDLPSNVEARKYPFAFITAPSVSASYSGGSSDAWLISVFKASDDPLTSAPAYALARPNSATIIKPRISYYVIGKYK